MESNVANRSCASDDCTSRDDCTCGMCRDLPDALDEALELLDFDDGELQAHLDGAHAVLHDDSWSDSTGDSTIVKRIELTFQHHSPVYDDDVARYCQMQNGTWMQYSCDLTDMWVAVREGAPIPIVALYGTTTESDSSPLQCYKIHPDLLQDRRRLLRAAVEQLESEVLSGVRQAQKALDSLRVLSDLNDLPGCPTEGTCYPAGRGYEPLGDRPLPADD